MIRFIFTKIKNKYKLYFCLVIGIVTIIAVTSLIMMFRNGSLNKLIQSSFITSYEKNNSKYPATLSRLEEIEYKPNTDMVKLATESMDSYEKSWEDYLELPVISYQRLLMLKGRNIKMPLTDKDMYFDIYYLDPLMEGHFDYTEGGSFDSDISKYLSGGLVVPEDAYPCLVSQSVADKNNIVVGEVMTLDKLFDRDESKKDNPVLKFVITGIITEKPNDYYWQSPLLNTGGCVYISKDSFNDILNRCEIESVFCTTNTTFDYRYIKVEDISYFKDALKFFHSKDNNLTENISAAIAAYDHDSTSLKAILYVISLPLLILVLLFIGMISFRIVDSERDEISQLTRRGIRRSRIILLYVIQSSLLAVLSYIPGIFLGYFVGKTTAGVDDFLGFHIGKDALKTNSYTFTLEMLPAGLIALVLVVIITVIPVIISTGNRDVVHKRKRKSNGNIPLWEKYFLDVIFLGLSVYLLINYNKQLNDISLNVLDGKGIDPVIFLNSTLFLISCGLIILRLSNYLLVILYKILKNRLKPAAYAGVLQILRSRQKTGTLSIFLVITVAMSLFNANMARTINSNQELRIAQNLGSDIVINENWNITVVGQPGNQKWKYNEPDIKDYEYLVNEGKANSVTKVVRDTNALLISNKKDNEDVTLLGIISNEFGKTAKMSENVNEKHWFSYLNDMSQITNGAIISSSLAKSTGVKVGDTITYARRSPIDSNKLENQSVKVTGIVDAWPGYERYVYSYNENGKIVEKENHLIVTNFSNVLSTFNVRPYEIWINTDHNEDEIREYLDEKFANTTRSLKTVHSYQQDVKEMKSSALIQITNGLFTAMFIIALFLCIMGFMIHWISSIRDRTLMFGIYRAMGITMSEVEHMLVIEQIFLSLISIVAGVISGAIATKLFSKVFAVVYLPQKHSMPLRTIIDSIDMIRLGVIMILTVLICMIVLRSIIRKMNITQALKLGED